MLRIPVVPLDYQLKSSPKCAPRSASRSDGLGGGVHAFLLDEERSNCAHAGAIVSNTDVLSVLEVLPTTGLVAA